MAKRFKHIFLCEWKLYVMLLVVCRCAGKRYYDGMDEHVSMVNH